jgi:hypothetical protein
VDERAVPFACEQQSPCARRTAASPAKQQPAVAVAKKIGTTALTGGNARKKKTAH